MSREFSFPQGKIPSALTAVQRLSEAKKKPAPKKTKRPLLYDDDSENDDPSIDDTLTPAIPADIAKQNSSISDELHRLIVQRMRESQIMTSRPSKTHDGSFFSLTFAERVSYIEMRYGNILQDMMGQLECVRCLKKYREIDNFGRWECTYHCGGGTVDFDTHAVIWSCCKRNAASGTTSDSRRGCTRCDHTVNHLITIPTVPITTQVESLLLPIFKPQKSSVLPNTLSGKSPETSIKILRAEDTGLHAHIDGRFANREVVPTAAPRAVFRTKRTLAEEVFGTTDDFLTKPIN